MICRLLSQTIDAHLKAFPAVILVGPRQIGKTTLALGCGKTQDIEYIALDDYQTLGSIRIDPRHYLRKFSNKLVIIDEIQKFPNLLLILRDILDEYIRAGHKTSRFLLLSSASKNMLKHNCLAGRVSYLELSVLLPTEVATANTSKDINYIFRL